MNTYNSDDRAYYNTVQFAPVCGIQMYEKMAIKGCLPYYHLLLAHDILARPERYKDVFTAMHYRRHNPTIILDNSVVELKSPIADVAKVAEAASTVKANVIVLPDIYKDAEATAKSCRDHYITWRDTMDYILGEGNYTFMMVPQGKTLNEFTWCAEQFTDRDKFPNIGWWGVPRNLVELHGSRWQGLNILRTLRPDRNIHMLGFSDIFIDDIQCCNLFHGPQLRGIDSAVPLRTKDFSLTAEVPPRPEGWLETAEFEPWVEQNIAYVQNLLR